MGYEVQVRYGPTVRVIDPKGNATVKDYGHLIHPLQT
jgi:hypothetical protein